MRETGKTRKRVRVAAAGCMAVVAVICVAQSSTRGTGQTGMQTGMQSGSHQTGGAMPASTGGSSNLGPPSGLDNISSPFPDSSRQRRNDDRQRRLVNDTQKLLALTSQLKAEVASTGAETMSPEMLKQMDEIEKLAKSVKDKMRD